MDELIIEYFRGLIKERGLKNSYVAEGVGMSHRAFLNRMNYRTRLSNMEFLRFCRFFSVNPDVFLDIELESQPKEA